jgi:hypothetical protein
MSSIRRLAVSAACCLPLLALGASNLPRTPPKELHALFGVGAQACKVYSDVAQESNAREIALSGAMFSWAQGWFSARNLIGHESSPLSVGGLQSVEALKGMLADECKAHPDEPIYLAVNDLYERLARKGP